MSPTLATSTVKLPTSKKKGGINADSMILSGVFALLFLGPLAFGAVEAWSIFILEAGCALLFAFWVWKQTSNAEFKIRHHPLFAPILLFGGVICVQLCSV